MTVRHARQQIRFGCVGELFWDNLILFIFFELRLCARILREQTAIHLTTTDAVDIS